MNTLLNSKKTLKQVKNDDVKCLGDSILDDSDFLKSLKNSVIMQSKQSKSLTISKSSIPLPNGNKYDHEYPSVELFRKKPPSNLF